MSLTQKIGSSLVFFTGATYTFSQWMPRKNRDSLTQRMERLLPWTPAPSVFTSIPGKDVAIFGFAHCKYDEVRRGLQRSGLTYHTPDRELHELPEPLTGDGFHYIEKLPRNSGDRGSICKNYLSNLLLENHRREKEGTPPIPVIFCLDIQNNPHPESASPLGILPRSLSFLTAQEVRRAFRLTQVPNPEIAELAKRTFRFVRVDHSREGFYNKFSFQEIPPPWNDSRWNSLWEERVRSRSHASSAPTLDWRTTLNTAWENPRPLNYSPNKSIFDSGLISH